MEYILSFCNKNLINTVLHRSAYKEFVYWYISTLANKSLINTVLHRSAYKEIVRCHGMADDYLKLVLDLKVTILLNSNTTQLVCRYWGNVTATSSPRFLLMCMTWHTTISIGSKDNILQLLRIWQPELMLCIASCCIRSSTCQEGVAAWATESILQQ